MLFASGGGIAPLTADDVWRQFNAALTIERPRELASTLPGQWLANLTEWERRDVLLRVLPAASASPRLPWLWTLGNAFFKHGIFRLAASIFLGAALTEDCNEETKAALFVKAGAAGNDGCLGAGVDRWIVLGTRMLDRLDQRSGAVRLIRFLAEYTATRYFYFMDAPIKAREHFAQVQAAAPAVGLLLGIHPSLPIPDVLLLQSQIARCGLGVFGDGNLRDVLSPLEALSGSDCEPVILDSTLVHHREFQRAAALRLDPRHLAQASDAANVSCQELTGTSIADVCRDVDAFLPHVNRRRLGYLCCLAAEIELDSGPLKTAKAIAYLHSASRAWSDPPYIRGLSRAAQLEAVLLMREGRRWSQASRMLSEAIAYARSGEAVACEARAVASKVALHSAMVHTGRAKQYEDRLSKLRGLMHAHWPTHVELERLKAAPLSSSRGERPRPSEHVKSIASDKGLWGDDPAFLEALALAEAVAPRQNLRVFIKGERGVGKTQLAKFIHTLSGRKGRFYTLSLGQTTETLAGDALFGHKKGAFDGATEDVLGALEMADKGTLFLDDVTDASDHIQRRLHQFLDDGHILRLGDPEPRKVDTTVIFASNKNLDDEVREGRFRDELRDRIDKFPIELPPLRLRGRDIVTIGNMLFSRFIERERGIGHGQAAAGDSNRFQDVTGLSTRAWDALCQYGWPGNIRELNTAIELLVTHLALSPDLADYINEEGEVSQGFVVKTFPSKTAEVREELLIRTLPIAPSELKRLCLQQQFPSRAAAADYLIDKFPSYVGERDGLLKLIRRNERFNLVFDQYFSALHRPRAQVRTTRRKAKSIVAERGSDEKEKSNGEHHRRARKPKRRTSVP